MTLDGRVPGGPLADKWARRKFEMKLVNPANRRKYTVIVVGTGLAGASAAATLGELGYNVLAFTILDSPRRAHSIAAQGGINAAKNYKNDGDSIERLLHVEDPLRLAAYKLALSSPSTAGLDESTRRLLAGLHFGLMPSSVAPDTLEASLQLLHTHPAIVEELGELLGARAQLPRARAVAQGRVKQRFRSRIHDRSHGQGSGPGPGGCPGRRGRLLHGGPGP